MNVTHTHTHAHTHAVLTREMWGMRFACRNAKVSGRGVHSEKVREIRQMMPESVAISITSSKQEPIVYDHFAVFAHKIIQTASTLLDN